MYTMGPRPPESPGAENPGQMAAPFFRDGPPWRDGGGRESSTGCLIPRVGAVNAAQRQQTCAKSRVHQNLSGKLRSLLIILHDFSFSIQTPEFSCLPLAPHSLEP